MKIQALAEPLLKPELERAVGGVSIKEDVSDGSKVRVKSLRCGIIYGREKLTPVDEDEIRSLIDVVLSSKVHPVRASIGCGQYQTRDQLTLKTEVVLLHVGAFRVEVEGIHARR